MKMKGGKIDCLTRLAGMVKIDFEVPQCGIWCLHIQKALFRVLESNNLIITNWDMGKPSKNFKGNRFYWDKPGNNLYDDQIVEHKEKILGATIDEIIINGKDLMLRLDKNLRIDVISYTLELDNEVYRVFEKESKNNHFIVET